MEKEKYSRVAVAAWKQLQQFKSRTDSNSAVWDRCLATVQNELPNKELGSLFKFAQDQQSAA